MRPTYHPRSPRAQLRRSVGASVAALAMSVAPMLVAESSHGAAARVAAPVGGPVTTLARDGAAGPAVAVDRFGTTTVVWAHNSLQGDITAVRRPAGGQWSQPVTLGTGARPQIGVDNQGAVTVVWQDNRDGHTAGVVATRRPPAGPWQPPVRVSMDVAAPDYHPSPDMDEDIYGAANLDLSVSPGGAALVAWRWGSDHRNVPYRIQAVHRPATGPWSDVAQLTPADFSNNPSVAAGRDGAAQVVYESPDDGPLTVRRRLTTGAWTSPVTIFSRETNGHELLMDPAGNATVLVDDFTAVFAVRRPAAGPWRAPVRVSPGRLGDAAVDRAGTVSVAVVRNSDRLQVVRRPAGGTWGPPVSIGFTQLELHVTLSVSPAGDLLASWENPQTSLVARGRISGVGWTPRFEVLGPGGFFFDPASAAANGGGGVFAWQKNGDKVQVRVFR